MGARAMSPPQPPPGFVLEEQNQQIPAPPSGFVMEGAEPKIEPAPLPEVPTLDERAQKILGLDPNIKRGALLPRFVEGQFPENIVAPQFVADIAKSALLPGHVVQGGTYTQGDVTKAALDILPTTRVGALGRGQTKREFLDAAPTREALREQSGRAYQTARQQGIVARGDAADLMIARIEGEANKFGVDSILTPQAHRVMELWRQRAGQDLSLDDLQIMRRQADTAIAQAKSDAERSIGRMMKDSIDEFVETLEPSKLASNTGDPQKAAKALKEARSLWQRQKKIETIDRIFELAETQASGFENGLRIGFRALLRDQKRLRGFNKTEINEMKKAANGGPVRTLLLKLGKLGYGGRGSNSFLGGAMGSVVGHQVAGPVGAVAVPAIGYTAQRGAAGRAAAQGDLVRALIAQGGRYPERQLVSPLTAALIRQWGPLAGTQLESRAPLVPQNAPN